jgi:hypothetical protein
MSAYFAILRYFPYWAIPLVLVACETALFARRKGRRSLMISCLLFAVFTLAAVGAWFYFRGDLHSNDWIRETISDS